VLFGLNGKETANKDNFAEWFMMKQSRANKLFTLLTEDMEKPN